MSIYRAPDPPMGPDRPSDAYPPGPGHAEWRAARRMLRWARLGLLRNVDYGGVLIDPLGPEQFASHEDYRAARELGEWGCNPFEEE